MGLNTQVSFFLSCLYEMLLIYYRIDSETLKALIHCLTAKILIIYGLWDPWIKMYRVMFVIILHCYRFIGFSSPYLQVSSSRDIRAEWMFPSFAGVRNSFLHIPQRLNLMKVMCTLRPTRGHTGEWFTTYIQMREIKSGEGSINQHRIQFCLFQAK
jgi:hypothetical protein